MTTPTNVCRDCGKPLAGVHTCSPQVVEPNLPLVISSAEARELAQWCSEIAAWGLPNEPGAFEINRCAAALKSLAAQVERLQQERKEP